MSGMGTRYFPTFPDPNEWYGVGCPVGEPGELGPPGEPQDDATTPDPPTPPTSFQEAIPTPDVLQRTPGIGHAGTYPGPERLGLMFLAMRDGVYATAREHGVPTRTLASWFVEYGSLPAVQEWLRAETLGSFLRCEQSLYRELERRLPDWPNDELGMTLRALVNARAVIPAEQAREAQPIAAAQANVTVTIGDKDGQRVIDLGPPPEETE